MKFKITLSGINPDDEDIQLDAKKALQEMNERYDRGQITGKAYHDWYKQLTTDLARVANFFKEIQRERALEENDND